MFFISENGAVIYKGDQLYNYRSFNRKEFQNVVDYLNIDHNMKELIVCGIKSAYILKTLPTRLKKTLIFIIISWKKLIHCKIYLKMIM